LGVYRLEALADFPLRQNYILIWCTGILVWLQDKFTLSEK